MMKYKAIMMLYILQYHGSIEAVYRMIEYDVIDAKPSMERLEVHLHVHQISYF